jgi:hypothetical protein
MIEGLRSLVTSVEPQFAMSFHNCKGPGNGFFKFPVCVPASQQVLVVGCLADGSPPNPGLQHHDGLLRVGVPIRPNNTTQAAIRRTTWQYADTYFFWASLTRRTGAVGVYY